LSAGKRIEADVLSTVARAARSTEEDRIDDELLRLADHYLSLGDTTGADTPEIAAVSSLEWSGRSAAARSLLDIRTRHRVPGQLGTLHDLIVRALEGPPWSLDSSMVAQGTSLHHERALLHLLRGDQDDADTLLRERYSDLLMATGSGHQRSSPYFPGALIAALGPADTEPDVAWLLDWIHRPPFPGLWVVHRAICALLLSERADPPEPDLAEAAMRLLDSTNADDSVRQWIGERAERSVAHRDRGV
jgi:hypothetical protein